jgi:hypothetical protein
MDTPVRTTDHVNCYFYRLSDLLWFTHSLNPDLPVPIRYVYHFLRTHYTLLL